jgi:hypothetical protein
MLMIALARLTMWDSIQDRATEQLPDPDDRPAALLPPARHGTREEDDDADN